MYSFNQHHGFLPTAQEGWADAPPSTLEDPFRQVDSPSNYVTNQHSAPMDFGSPPPQDHTLPEDETHAVPPASRAASTSRAVMRYSDSQWDSHKAELKKLYLVEDKALREVMEIMETMHEFAPRIKQYKDKFRAWGWQKNLPVEIASWMVRKAHSRKRDRNIDTVFDFGGLTWDKDRALVTVKRRRKELSNEIDMETPNNVTYHTPNTSDDDLNEQAHSLRHKQDDGEPVMISSSSDEDDESDEEDEPPVIVLTHKGRTAADYKRLVDDGRVAARNPMPNGAAEMLHAAIEGLTQLLSATHEDVSKVVCLLLSHYFEEDNEQKARAVLEESCKDHIEQLGIEHRRTQQHFNNIIELLNGCQRQEYALTLLARLREIKLTMTSARKGGRRQKRQAKGHSTQTTSMPRASSHRLSDQLAAVSWTRDPSALDEGLSVARCHAEANETAAEELFLAILKQCGSNTTDLVLQRLQAHVDLLSMYIRLGHEFFHEARFADAQHAVKAVLQGYPWEEGKTRQKFRTLRVIELLLEVIVAQVRAQNVMQARVLFANIDEKAAQVWAWNDERRIWVQITIGIVYQRYRGWSEAREWFEQALAVAIARYDEGDGVRISLEEAMEKRHFSYVDDEGRPFQTIFGVSGVTIRPNRLHLE